MDIGTKGYIHGLNGYVEVVTSAACYGYEVQEYPAGMAPWREAGTLVADSEPRTTQVLKKVPRIRLELRNTDADGINNSAAQRG